MTLGAHSHLPAADRGRKAAPAPIKLPSLRAVEDICRTRANSDNQRWQQQVERRDALISAAANEGYTQGERAGYTSGWHWGLACGICIGGVSVGLLWLVWAPLHALAISAVRWWLS